MDCSTLPCLDRAWNQIYKSLVSNIFLCTLIWRAIEQEMRVERCVFGSFERIFAHSQPVTAKRWGAPTSALHTLIFIHICFLFAFSMFIMVLFFFIVIDFLVMMLKLGSFFLKIYPFWKNKTNDEIACFKISTCQALGRESSFIRGWSFVQITG